MKTSVVVSLLLATLSVAQLTDQPQGASVPAVTAGDSATPAAAPAAAPDTAPPASPSDAQATTSPSTSAAASSSPAAATAAATTSASSSDNAPAATTGTPTQPSDNNAQPCSNEGDSKCASDGQNKFWSCAGGKWQLMTCDGNSICGQTGENKAVCHDPNSSIQLPQATPVLEKCDHVGDAKCAADGKNKYYSCTKDGWMLMTCDGNTICGQTGESKAVCHDPNSSIELPQATPVLEKCDHVGDAKCAADGKNKYYSCTKDGWQLLTCDGDTICGQTGENKAVCHDPNSSIELPQATPVLEKCDHVGDAKCASDGKNKYYSCTKDGWQLSTCDGNTVCGQADENKVVCHDPNKPLETTKPEPNIPCDKNNATMCDDKNKNSFYTCTNNKWASLSCADGNECRVVKNNAVCMDPNSPTPSDDGQDDAQESLAPCDTLNATMCDSSHKSKFYTCVDHKWTSMKCDGDNVCVVRNNKAKCLDKATADAPQQPCKIEKATQCAPDNKNIYQVCTDHYWTNSTCANNNHCLFRNGKALCVDKATAEAPQLPCKNDKETQCVSDDKSIFQVCVDKFWTNSTCDKGNVCGMKKGKAICHDPNESIKDVPELPCDKDKATRCVLGNQTLYQVCSNKLWTNLTCDGGNVCRMKSDAVVCVDKHTAEEASSVYSMGTPSAYVPTASRATSMNALYSWGIGALLAAISVAFGASL